MLKKYKLDFSSLKKLDFKLLTTLVILISFGIINIYLCTKGGVFNDPFLFTKKQLIWFFISLISMCLFLTFDYRVIYQYVPIIYWITIALLIAVWIPGIGTTIKGERGWIDLKFFLLQPSEVAKFSIILILAKLLDDMDCHINNWENLKKVLFYVALPMGLILIQKDMGMTMVCFFIILGMVYIAGLDVKIILGGFSTLILVIALLWNSGLIFQHQKDRILEFLNTNSNTTGNGYQLYQGLISIGSGGLFGYSLSLDPNNPLGYAGTNVPEVQTDFIFTAIAEQWGFIGALFLLFLYGLLIIQILKIAKKARDKFGEFICVGMASYILFATTQNIGMTLGLLPITGITLPFISYGGSSLFTTMISIALILNIEISTKKLTFSKSNII
ncbi:FtsW/RodA/SpoVE family cell cycle protein [Clostridium botulinum]|uniref:FtsW/RodA/SpoVE family cell cycle protein n=1 Tax=Clostridium botulinum TaxID=1491 RepID=UPI001C9A89A4|nr:FtsW/RodA/SpoVE family cell cycle protein [Clostridium botulinum]MBY6809296.1 rod shape-determining protein RodA [Clostridium botulinum]MBY6822738.1 rod shape-determining protein RodA [Clostridium botulinum]MBY6833350.1 rod shape-determining protein RodA [Clostridium botulinum]MBY6971411.1 rod shape-determining protein RodA [Clostridium botulinum]MCS6102723.1 rod shape-determining protein RodA [Clostridium botulinum]